ncbi:MAG: DNA repair protein RecO [Proteobacteria bacterium]|nr:DNA repair protein RecO [Pseudomonadota bacterium]
MKPGPYRFKAVILSRTQYGEADLIVNFLTREHGKMSGLARHGRKSRKRFGNVLLSPALVELAFTQPRGRDLVRLDQGDLVRSFEGLGRDFHLLALGQQSLELADAFCAPLDPAPDVFDWLVWSLERMDVGVRPRETAFIFQLKLLILTGFGPNLAACPLCGRPPEDGRTAELKPEHGGLVCRRCSPGGFSVSPGTLKIMSLIQGLPLDRIDRVRIGDASLDEASPFLLSSIRSILGRDLKTARFVEPGRVGPPR